jgi:hypothetical protein
MVVTPLTCNLHPEIGATIAKSEGRNAGHTHERTDQGQLVERGAVAYRAGTTWIDPGETMMRFSAVASCTLLLTTILISGHAEEPKRDHFDKPQADDRYIAGLGEIMSATQMRHAKLWFAANAKNWRLADFELNEIEEGFEDAMKFHPVFKEIPVAVLLDTFTEQPMLKLKDAVENEDDRQFNAAFTELTAACNACHQAVNRGFIVITTPSISPVSNQKYAMDSAD